MIKDDNNKTGSETMTTAQTILERGRKMNNLQNEGADGYDHTDRTALMVALKAQRIKRDAEWTLETTVARRAEWNDASRSISNATPKMIADKVGYKMADLVAAVTRHGVK